MQSKCLIFPGTFKYPAMQSTQTTEEKQFMERCDEQSLSFSFLTW